MDIFEITDSIDALFPADEKEAVLYYLQSGDEEHALACLDRVGMLDRMQVQRFLTVALRDDSPAFFKRLLGHVPRGEYYWLGPPFLPDDPQGFVIQIAGTLPTLAAALDKPEHLRLLLDWGCDVNGASLDAATALAGSGFELPDSRDEPIGVRGVPIAQQDSTAWWRDEKGIRSVSGLTPLAAAILLGSVDCTRLLLEREGVWGTETPSVSEALTLRGAPYNTEAHRECRRLVRTRTDGTLRPLVLWAAIRRMDATALRDELCRCEYSEEEIRRAALALTECRTIDQAERWAMLSILDGRYPAVLRGERVARALAGLVYCDLGGRREPLPAAAERALGETVDLDASTVGAANYSSMLAELCFERFGGNRKLVMSRDCVCDYETVSARFLRVLFKHVEFRTPSLPLGVSGLTAAILRSGDTQLLRTALNRGLIPAEEPLERLLELAGRNTAARSLLLTRSRPSLGCAPAEAERESFRELSVDEAERVLTDPVLRAQASDTLLWQLDKKMLERLVDSKDALSAEGIETLNYAALFALRGETDAVLRLALRRQGDGSERAELLRVWRADAPDDDFILSLLCCAALAGQTETVRALLDAGFDPEERDMGRPSEMWDDRGTTVRNYEILALSPLLCALLWERWDTAALLLEHGAACDLTAYTVRRVFESVRGGDVPMANIRRELGSYLEGRKLEKTSAKQMGS